MPLETSFDIRCVLFSRGRIIPKRINVRIEHVKHSNCRLDFLNRVEQNEIKKKEAKENKVRCPQSELQRIPKQPKAGKIIRTKNNQPIELQPIPYEFIA